MPRSSWTTSGACPVVTAPEEIDITNADALRATLLATTADGHATLVVDLAHTLFCDTAGLDVLAGAARTSARALAEGGELRLVVPSVPVLRAFAIASIDRVIPHFRTLDEALAPMPAVTIRLRRRDLPPPGQRFLTGLLVPVARVGT